MPAAGYSGTPLPKKLGLKDGQTVAFCDLPESQRDLLKAANFVALEEVRDWRTLKGRTFDFIHLFTKSAATVVDALPVLRDRIKPDGMIWVSWPKKASKVPTDLTEDTIRNRALADVLVDVKVCAVDDIWSGLKLVIRKELRAGHCNAVPV
ncbi:Protein of unknown function [Cognatiyoonia koreensis]|uniref:DUF3052 domain-containing protein n=1 Tax=Cognatiyoonia koreensis TaxID=364200 RepID=A0A1I0QMG5_9RHOB|nr:DUF3052 family protein [Cognatiyoonia koreensis]SEW28550.1 Protein of unknown function [Cognatiyoonia koreensis]